MLMPMGEDRSLEARVSALESEVRQLRAELLRREAREPFVAEPVMAAPVEAHAEPAFRLDLETLVGRYGMLGLATLLALAAIGTFVSWAAARGLFGPTTRVILGFVAAVGIAAAGLMLRPRSRSFSDSLLALALSAIFWVTLACRSRVATIGTSQPSTRRKRASNSPSPSS